jgi:GTPase SAR1 family protein
MYYGDSNVILIVYDVCSEESFSDAKDWIEMLQAEQLESNLVLLANKVDLTEDRQITTKDGQALARQYEIPYREVTATSYTSVESLFENLTRHFVGRRGSRLSSNGTFL